MSIRKDELVFDADAYQGIDIEKASINNIGGRRSPTGQPVVLSHQKGVYAIGIGVQSRHARVDRGGDLRLLRT